MRYSVKYGCYGWLSGGILLRWIETYCWHIQFACCDDDLVIQSDLLRLQALAELAREARNGIQLMCSVVSTTSVEMFCFWTAGEMYYLAALNNMYCTNIDYWTWMEFVARDSWVWQEAQLRADFRYIRKTGAFGGVCEDEGRWCSRWGRQFQFMRYLCF